MEPKIVPDISIVIVSHNHSRYLSKCLESLDPTLHVPHLEIFVVDNCSTDGSADLVRNDFPWVNLIENDQIRGFATNNNLAIRKSNGRYLLILNPDTETPPNALEKLLDFAEQHSRAGICGPQLRFPDGQIQPSCRHFPTLASVLARRTILRKFFLNSTINANHLMIDFNHNSTSRVDWMLGACLLVRRDFLSEVGLMDEGYYLYVEDIDWCYRAKKADWEVWYFSDAYFIHHHLAESDRRLFGRMSWHHYRSMLRYYVKHLAPDWARLIVKHEQIQKN